MKSFPPAQTTKSWSAAGVWPARKLPIWLPTFGKLKNRYVVVPLPVLVPAYAQSLPPPVLRVGAGNPWSIARSSTQSGPLEYRPW
jgi:predicted DNA repair protein MutK